MSQLPLAQERQIRVFISSTFRDMHAERDRLVKVVFPQLRRLCESRGVTWGEVDLRWGVSRERRTDWVSVSAIRRSCCSSRRTTP